MQYCTTVAGQESEQHHAIPTGTHSVSAPPVKTLMPTNLFKPETSFPGLEANWCQFCLRYFSPEQWNTRVINLKFETDQHHRYFYRTLWRYRAVMQHVTNSCTGCHCTSADKNPTTAATGFLHYTYLMVGNLRLKLCCKLTCASQFCSRVVFWTAAFFFFLCSCLLTDGKVHPVVPKKCSLVTSHGWF